MIKVSQGYGMPFQEFVEATTLPSRGVTIWDDLHKNLSGTKNIIIDHEVVTDKGWLTDLFVPVMDGHVIIFPTIGIKLAWHYRDNPIAFDTKSQYTKTTYLDIPLMDGIFMDHNGVEVESPHGCGDPALRPGIPRVMRKWLLRYGVFDLSGVAKLRPMMAQWKNDI